MKTCARIFTLILLTAFITSCARDLSSSTYTSSATDGIVYEGVVISARQVTVKDSDQLGSQPGIGTLGGGLAGGIGGSQIGRGKGSAVAAVGGAVAGAVIGSLVEDRLKTSTGIEYLVKLDNDSIDDAPSSNKNYTVNGGKQSVSDKLRNSTSTKLKSKIISVVQGTDIQIPVGQPVYVIYNDNRPRLVAKTI